MHTSLLLNTIYYNQVFFIYLNDNTLIFAFLIYFFLSLSIKHSFTSDKELQKVFIDGIDTKTKLA